ncbi:acyl-CoA thioesterase [Brevibacillus sp. SYP-B805]|uniref:acyl-CoA thioesterase n=1 Tax=Brevibacillus sp. SYP-B805 TaxID=1578199 RepID=UPI001F49A747
MAYVLEHTVRSTELDALGHVNNARYLDYMEWGRMEWLFQAGFTWEELNRRQILPVVVNANINYRQELRLREKVKIVSTVGSIGKKSFVIRHEIWKENGTLACDADFTMVIMDAVARRAIELPEDLVAELRRHVTESVQG